MTSIEWTRGDDGSEGKTWNPIRGCALVSPGCTNCYAMKQAHRFSGKGQSYEGLTVLGKHGPRWTGSARFIPEMLGAPLHWKRPRRVFVNSMSDLFHEDIAIEQIAAIFGVMAASPTHTFQILTKRPALMKHWFSWVDKREAQGREMFPDDEPSWRIGQMLAVELRKHGIDGQRRATRASGWEDFDPRRMPWPLPNVWLGVSCEDQKRADERIHVLAQCPAAIRFLSLEPLLGPITVPFGGVGGRAFPDWVIVGGESGPGARRCDVAWVRSIVEQCKTAGVACFVKQLGASWTENRGRTSEDIGGPCRTPYVEGGRVTEDGTVERTLVPSDRKGGDPREWPEDLRDARAWPEVHT